MAGTEFTACALAIDPDNNLAGVSLRYVIGECEATVSATLVDFPIGPDQWCATIPAECSGCYTGSAYLYFTATDICGQTAITTCSTFVQGTLPPNVSCWPGNPATVPAGSPVTICALASDPDGAVVGVEMLYESSSCLGTVDAVLVPAGGGDPERWCYTVPGSCASAQGDLIIVRARSRDECGIFSTASYCSVRVTMPVHSDLGDLPNPPYPTYSRNVGGPAHQLTGICWLGTTIGGEPTPYLTADGDPSDDGFLTDCQAEFWSNCSEVTAAVVVTTGGGYTGQPMYLSAWIDMNGNGILSDAIICPTNESISEWVIPNRSVTPGPNFFGFPVHNTGSANGAYAIRVRLSTQPFTINGYTDPAGTQRTDGEVEDYVLQCATDECCFMCEAPEAPLFRPANVGIGNDFRLTARFENDNRIHLNWNAIPNAQYYDIYRGGVSESIDDMDYVGSVVYPTTTWIDSLPTNLLPAKNFYQVTAHGIIQQVDVPGQECARWEMNEGSGEYTYDVTGNGHDARRFEDCPPEWGIENDAQCNFNPAGFLNFDGYVYTPERCEEHLVVQNDPVFYGERFQLWTRLRLAEEPTVASGPFYIASNNSFDSQHGGWALRIDPGWITLPDGTREYHNRLTGFVWDRRFGANGGWRTLQSPPPSVANPGMYSVPVGQWSCICFVVNDRESMLIIDGRVVASGRMDYDSDNNGAPLIIGGGYRHSTYPIEYPFRGDIDCMRITCLE